MSKKMDAYGIITVILSAVGNLMNLIWTVWLTLEQIETGWGYGTNIDLAVLMPWLTEILCIPIFIAGIVYFILNIFKRSNKRIFRLNAALYSALLLQILVTNLFIWF